MPETPPLNGPVPSAAKPAAGLTGDLWGGLAAMLVALPSAIAFGVTIYAPLGGGYAAQGAVAGILGATVLGLIATAFGGTQRLISAPCAPAAAVLSALAITFTQQELPPELVLLMLGMVGLLAGLIQIGLGSMGVGRLIKYIPYPVVSGYLSAVGLIIIGSQIPKLLGSPAGTELLTALAHPGAWSWQAIVVGITVILSMTLAPLVSAAVPGAIVALIAGVGCYLALGLLDPALMTTTANPLLIGQIAVGDINPLHTMASYWNLLGGLGLQTLWNVLAPALTLAVLLSIDTLKTCVVLDALTNSSHDPNRELVGQGLGNMASAMVGGISGAGTMGASLVNLSSGGTTRRSGLIAGGLSLAALVMLAPLIAWLPVSALAGILIVIGVRMIDRHSLQFFFTPTTRLDFAVIVLVILTALFVNLIAASGVGVALAILLFIREQTRSSVVRNRFEGSDFFSGRARNRNEPQAATIETGSVVVFELQGSLFFGTANQLHAALEPETTTRKYVILSMRRVQSLDVTATHVLEQIKDRLEENDAYLVFCDIPKGLPSGLKMKRFLKDTGVVRPTNKAFAFRQLDDALEWVETQSRPPAQPAEDDTPLALRAMPLLARQDPQAVAALESMLSEHTVRAGKKVYKAGLAHTDLLFIRRGIVKVSVPIRGKEHYHLATVGKGAALGSMGFLAQDSQAAEALAVTDVDIYALPATALAVLAEQHPALALAIAQHQTQQLANYLRISVAEIQALRS
jgi:SulP family sulfate permease